MAKQTMINPLRDPLLLVSLVLVETVLPFAWHHSEGMLTRSSYWPQPGVWISFAFLVLADVFLLTLNLWAICRGEFRWGRFDPQRHGAVRVVATRKSLE